MSYERGTPVMRSPDEVRRSDMPGMGPTRRHVKRSRGGLVFKAHRLLHHPTLGSSVIKKEKKMGPTRTCIRKRKLTHPDVVLKVYRGTSLIRNSLLLGPYSRTKPDVLRGMKPQASWARTSPPRYRAVKPRPHRRLRVCEGRASSKLAGV